MSLAELASSYKTSNVITKPLSFYQIYDIYFGQRKDDSMNIVEVGVFEGQSTKIFAQYFSNSKILALDLQDHGVEFSKFDNIEYQICNQNDRLMLSRRAAEKFPQGIDIVVEDASHIGSFSKNTFEALIGLVKSGGIYVIEDWGTGYWSEWADGSDFEYFNVPLGDNDFQCRFPSHDFGMVGFIKNIIDLVGYQDINHHKPNAHAKDFGVREMHLFPGTCVLKKA